MANWHGQASFTFKVVDQSDEASADAATATVTVSSVADAPVAGIWSVSTAEDTALTFAAADFDGVFTDGDSGDSLKKVKVMSLPASTAGVLALDDGETVTAVSANQEIAGEPGEAEVHAGGELRGESGDVRLPGGATRATAFRPTATATITVNAVERTTRRGGESGSEREHG